MSCLSQYHTSLVVLGLVLLLLLLLLLRFVVVVGTTSHGKGNDLVHSFASLYQDTSQSRDECPHVSAVTMKKIRHR
jgi:hypothetical protein